MMYRNRSATRLQHCAPGQLFFESHPEEDAQAEIVAGVPESWRTHHFGPWRAFFPPDAAELPRQGWKIHISSRPQDVDEILSAARRICVRRRISFKHLATLNDYRRAMMKYAHRSSSGKFVTIYPRNDDEFCEVLEELDSELNEYDGPYILSDVKFGKGPVFFRYGGFALDPFVRDNGASGFAIRTPDGKQVEDVRSPVFTLPDFVTPPPFVRELVHARLHPDRTELDRLLHPYSVVSSLHFSNAGGVYLGQDTRTGRQVVLKEARRWSAYSSDASDAIQRLRTERDALEALAHVDAVVDMIDYRVRGDHEFLIEEYVPGVTLQSWAASNYPFTTDTARLRSYSERALRIAGQIAAAVEEVHRAERAILDLQPKNVLVDGNEQVRLIDFEAARDAPDSAVGAVGTPGFIPHSWCSKIDRDRYALAAVVLHLFWPSLAGAFDPAVIFHRRDKVAELFPREVRALVDSLVEAIDPEILTTSHGHRLASAELVGRQRVIERLCAGVVQSRDPSSGTERRYPGDATQFTDGAGAMLNIETGAAGVALMLSRAGLDTRGDIAWLSQRLTDVNVMPFHGLLRGTSGIAAVLVQLGSPDIAELLVLTASADGPGRDLSIRTGLAGTVLALTDIAERTGRTSIIGLRDTWAELFAEHITSDAPLHSHASETGNAIGLFDGWAGVGVTCRRLAECTGDARWDRLMHLAFERELQQLTESEDGLLRVDYSGVSYGYLSEGAAGIAFALSQCAPDAYADVIQKLTASFDGIISLNGGLFRGAAGIAAALMPMRETALTRERSRLMHFTTENFLFHLPGEEPLLFLGDNGYHASADYSTGAAGAIGVLIAEQKSDPSWWFPVRLPNPIGRDEKGGKQDERTALTAGTRR